MGVVDEKKIHENNPGSNHTIIFSLLTLSIAILGLWLGGLGIGYFVLLFFGILFVNFFAGDNRYRFSIIYLFLAIGLLIGGLIYSRVIAESTIAWMNSLPLVGSLVESATVQTGLAVLAGLIGGGAAVYGSLELIFFVSIELILGLRQAYELDRKEARGLIRSLILGKEVPILIADEGKIKPESKGDWSKFGAPVAVTVKPYNALVLERGGKVSRIEGPGLIILQSGEEVKAVVDLRPQGNGDTAVALTKDGIPLTFNYSVAFRIESWKEARDRGDEGDLETQGFAGIIAGHYPVYRHTIYRAVYGVVAGKNWITQIKGMAGGKIGAAIRNFRVDEIFVIDQDERVTIEETALQKIITQAKNSAIAAGVAWGVKVGGLNIKTIEMPEESQKKFLTQWRVLWQEQQALIEAKVKRLIAIIEAEGKLDVSKIETEARQWSVIQEAIAKLKAAEHDMKRKRLVAEIGDELAQKEGQATITNAEAQRQASELQANAEIQFIENMAKALERALGPTAAREILKEMFKHRLNLEQMQRVMALIDPASRIKERFFGTGPSGWPREDDQPPPNQSEA